MRQIVCGIDPGQTESGVCVVVHEDGKFKIDYAAKMDNASLLKLIASDQSIGNYFPRVFAIEPITPLGQTMGQSLIDTIKFIAILEDRINTQYLVHAFFYPRAKYGRWLVPDGKLSDATLRAAIEEKCGSSSKKGDPLYSLRGASDKRSAFALAMYHLFKTGATSGDSISCLSNDPQPDSARATAGSASSNVRDRHRKPACNIER